MRDFLRAASALVRGMKDRSLRDALEFSVGAVATGDAVLGPTPARCVSIGSVRFLAISVLLMTKVLASAKGAPSESPFRFSFNRYRDG